MQGFILNEKGYVTFPYEILKHIEPYVKALKWKVSCVEHNNADNETFPLNEPHDYFLDSEELFSLLQQYSHVQWIWGVLSGFPNELSWEEIRGTSNSYDLTTEQPYFRNGLCHIEPQAVFELLALDSSETYILVDDEVIISSLFTHFPYAERLENELKNW